MLRSFIAETIEPGSVVHTDGWAGYKGLETNGYRHEVTVLAHNEESASELLPRVHRVASLLKRWLMGTHQGAVSNEYLDYYLDEFTFRFNRRRSRHRGKLFYRLVQQAVAAESPQTTEAYRRFDQALAAFKKGDYSNALQLDRQAIQKFPQDPVMHEVAALCMFATGDYAGAAAILNNLLAVAPGMDWTTMSGLYGDAEVYTTQLRALEARCRQERQDAAADQFQFIAAGSPPDDKGIVFQRIKANG